MKLKTDIEYTVNIEPADDPLWDSISDAATVRAAPRNAHRWAVTITNGTRSATFAYWTGSAVPEAHADEALECLLWDAECGHATFREFTETNWVAENPADFYDTWTACRETLHKLAGIGIIDITA